MEAASDRAAARAGVWVRAPEASGGRFSFETVLAGTALSPATSHAGATSRMFASRSTTRGRGITLPLTYWLTWLFPSFSPRAAAAWIRSACFMPHACIACRSRSANARSAMAPPVGIRNRFDFFEPILLTLVQSSIFSSIACSNAPRSSIFKIVPIPYSARFSRPALGHVPCRCVQENEVYLGSRATVPTTRSLAPSTRKLDGVQRLVGRAF